MGREFVNYTEALALKELGFNEPCFGCYVEDNNDVMFCHRPKNFNDLNYVRTWRSSPNDDVCSAPTFSQAFRWFRENHKLFGQVNICTYFIYDMSNNDGFHTTLEMVKQYDKLCDNYEEAELECLKKLIQIVKEKL